MSVSAERQSPTTALASAAGIGAIGFLVGMLCAIVAISLAQPFLAVTQGSPVVQMLEMLGMGIGLVGVGYVFLERHGLPPSYVRFRTPTLRDVGWAIVATVGLIAALQGLLAVIETLEIPLAQHGVAETIAANPTVALVLIPLSILVVGPTEEFLYRGVIQTRLRETFDVATTVVIASLIFALIHVPAYYLLADSFLATLATVLLVLFPLGALLGAVYEYTGNLFVPAVAHGLYNATVFAYAYADVVGLF